MFAMGVLGNRLPSQTAHGIPHNFVSFVLATPYNSFLHSETHLVYTA